jgi:protease PrsW
LEIVVSVGLSLAVGIFWLWYYYRQDVYDKEPIQFVALIFILSMPLSILTGLLQYTLDAGTGRFTERAGFLTASLFYLFVVAVTEELAKFFVVITVAYPNRAFNEPVDGIIYAIAASLGFATFENIFYILDRGVFVLLLRGPVSTLGHALFAAIWGAAVGMCLREKNWWRRVRLISFGLLLSILAHGFYNILVSLSYPFFGSGLEWLSLSGMVFLVFLYVIIRGQIRNALDISAFNPRNEVANAIERLRQFRRLQNSDEPVYAPNTFLKNGEAPPTVPCPNCGTANLPDAAVCYNCGIPLESDIKSLGG